MSTDRTKALALSIIMIASLGTMAVGSAGATGDATDSADRGIAMSEATSDTFPPSAFDGTVGDGHFEVGSGDDSEYFEIDGIEIDGDVSEDGSFYAAPGDVNFPDLEVEDTTAGDVDVEITAPDGLEGEIQEDGEMTMEGDLYIDLSDISDGCGIDVTTAMTTADSGEMTGEAIHLDGDEATGQATLVDNEFAVPETEGCGALGGPVDGELGLPSESGENEIEMAFDFEFDYQFADQGTVEGTVTDDDGEPVQGVNVEVDGTNQEVVTGTDGSYEFVVDEGDHTITASAEGYHGDETDVSVDADETASADLTITPDGDTDYRIVASPIEGEASDTVTTEVDVLPVSDDADEVDELGTILEYDQDALSFEGASAADWDPIEIDHDSGTVTGSADEGYFGDRIEAPFTAFTVEFELIGEPGTETSIGFDGENSDFSGDHSFLGIGDPGLAYADAPVSIDPIATLEGEVTDEDGEPVEDATVDVGGEELTTDADGTYATDLEPGEYDVDVSHDEFESQSASVQLEPGDTASVDVALGVPTGVVEGEVTDGDGEPVEGATVTAGDQQTTTDADGAYDLELEVGEYDLEVSADEFESDTASATVDDSATTAQDFTLEADDDGGETAPDEFDADEWADWLEAQAADFEDRYFEQVVDEINIQAEERTDGLVDELARHDHVNSPEEAREEAQYVDEEFSDVSDDTDEAVEALEDAADTVEDVYDALGNAAEDLRNADDPLAEVDRINDEVIAGVNADIDSSNEELENVEGVDHVPTIDADEDPDDPSDSDDEGADDGDEDDAMGATTQSFGVVISLLAIILALVAGGRSLVDANLLRKKPL